MLLSSLYVHFTQSAKLLSKYLEANFKHLLGMELVTDVIFFVLSSANTDLTIYAFVTGVVFHILVVGLPVQSTSVLKKSRCSD